MERDKKSFMGWVKEHREELMIAGVSFAVVIALIISIKNQKALKEAWESLRILVEKRPNVTPVGKPFAVDVVTPVKEIAKINNVTADRAPHDVAEHLRNLPEGWKASAKKIATAVEHGYDLCPGQTWVEAYRTGGLAA